jgi:hypothetical protein
MKLLNRLERNFGDWAIPNLTIILIALQTFTALMATVQKEFFAKLLLTHEQLMNGEWWRVLTVLVMPPTTEPIFLILFLYFYFLVGTTLEARWGTFRYNIYILIGYLATVLTAFIPGAIVTNFYLMESIFLAFAWLYPEYEILLFFVLPVKMKWLGLAGWIWYLIAFLTGNWATRAEVAAGAISFLIFFHADLWDWLKTSRRKFTGQMVQARTRQDANAPMHVCAECGVTDQSDRKMEFRYCPLCAGTLCYCINHIHTHKHRGSAA